MRIGLNPAFLFAHFGDKVFFDEIIAGASRAKELGFPSLGLETRSPCYGTYCFFIVFNSYLQGIRHNMEQNGVTLNRYGQTNGRTI